MFNRLNSCSQFRHFLAFGALACSAMLPGFVFAQQVPPKSLTEEAAEHDFVDLTGGSASITDYVLFPYEPTAIPGAFGIASRAGDFSQFTITNPAPEGAFTIGEFGVAVGLDGRDQQPTTTLHIAGGGDDDAYGSAQLFVEDRNPTPGLAELLRLSNNGGVTFRMDDIDADNFFSIENVVGLLEVGSGAVADPFGPVHFRIFNDSPNNALNIAPAGIGIGTFDPMSSLHILADGISSDFTGATIRGEVTNDLMAKDRVMLDLRNNGAVLMNLLDTSVASAMPFQIRSASDRFSVQQFGGNRAGFAVFSDGAIRYVANGLPNVTVTSNGNLNVIGQAGGGNLNVIGPAGGAGNLFVKGNIVYNGTISGPSDRNIKDNIQPIDPQQILAKVVDLPITRWNYVADEKNTPHLGPMAQDFYEAFGLGDDRKRIPLMDNSGVALAAIQGLHQVVETKSKMTLDAIKGLNEVVEAKEKKIAELNRTLGAQSELISQLNERLGRLEAMVISPQE